MIGGDRVGPARSGTLAAGLAIGAFVVWAFLGRYHIVSPAGLTMSCARASRGWIRQNVGNLPNTAWSLHGGAWFLIVMCLSLLWRAHPHYARALGGGDARLLRHRVLQDDRPVCFRSSRGRRPFTA